MLPKKDKDKSLTIRAVERLIHWGFWVAAALLIGMGVLLYNEIEKFNASSQWVVHTHEVLKDVTNVKAQYSRAESAERGFIISSNTSYLDEYRMALDEIHLSLKSLKSLTVDNPVQQERLGLLEGVLSERLAVLEQALQLYQMDGRREERNQINSIVGEQQARKPLFDLLGKIDREERRLLEIRRDEEARRSRTTLAVLGVALLISLVTLLPAYVAMVRQTQSRARAELLEQESNALLRLTVDSVPGMIFYMDRYGYFRFHNKAYAQLFDPSARSLVGDSVQEVMGSERYREVEPWHREVLRGKTMRFERRHVTDDGAVLDIDTLYLPRFDNAGEIQGHFGLLIDVTEHKREQRRLQQTNAFQEAILNLTDFSIIGIDTDGLIQSYNAGAERLLGYSAEEVVGKYSPMLFHTELEIRTRAEALSLELGRRIEANSEVFFAKAREGAVDEAEWTLISKDGSRVSVFLSVRALYSDTGEIIGYLEVADDVTARKEAEARFDRFFHLSPDLLCIAGTDHYFKRVNAVFGHTLGWSEDELMARPFLDFVHPEDKTSTLHETARLAPGTAAAQFENRYRCKDGSWRWLAWKAVLQPDGLIFATARDVTWQKEANQQLERATEEAEAASRAKSAFLATMSHEIRTPMNGVIGLVDVLAYSELSEHQSDLIKTIRSSAIALLTIIDDILDFSKIEAGKLEIEQTPLSITDLVESMCSSLLPIAHKKNVDLWLFVSPDIPDLLLSDDVRLRQILYNLLGNAIKFSGGQPEKRGRVLLQVERVSAEPHRLVFRIVDNGIGMKPETTSNIFTSFMQAEVSTTRRFGGTGLGLAICKRLVELMQGEIRVESEVGKGSTFDVVLPFETAPEAATRKLQYDPPVLTGVACLLVGSDEINIDALTTYLEYAGAQVRLVETAPLMVSQEPLGAPVVVIEKLDQKRQPQYVFNASFASGTEVPRLLITLCQYGHDGPANSPYPVTLDANGMRRDAFISAVALAAGRTSPAVFQERALLQGTETPAKPTTVREARAAGQLILVAEDDPVNQKVILQQLDLLGYAAEVASDGAEALRMWRNEQYALLITDVHMPEMDGFMLTGVIRREETDRGHMPIVALTANALRGEARRAQDAGMDEYLTKPVQIHLLKATLEKWLGQPDEATFRAHTVGEANAISAGVVDINVLIDLVGSDMGTLCDFLSAYRESTRSEASMFRSAFAAGDLQHIGKAAHRLKSSSRSIGAIALGSLCDDIEKACLIGEREAIAQYLSRFDAALAAVHAEAAILINSLSRKSEKT